MKLYALYMEQGNLPKKLLRPMGGRSHHPPAFESATEVC